MFFWPPGLQVGVMLGLRWLSWGHLGLMLSQVGSKMGHVERTWAKMTSKRHHVSQHEANLSQHDLQEPPGASNINLSEQGTGSALILENCIELHWNCFDRHWFGLSFTELYMMFTRLTRSLARCARSFARSHYRCLQFIGFNWFSLSFNDFQ